MWPVRAVRRSTIQVMGTAAKSALMGALSVRAMPTSHIVLLPLVPAAFCAACARASALEPMWATGALLARVGRAVQELQRPRDRSGARG